MKLISPTKTLLTTIALLAATTTQVLALSTDRDQPAEIEADDIEFDFKNGTRTYIKNVLVVQGTLRITADKVIANYGEKDLENATAWGSLARFKQRPDDKPDDTEGWARKIIVDQVKNTITLIGKAALKQGPNTARGDTIVYNMATDKMKISGASKVQSAGKDGQAPKRKLDDPFKDDDQGPPEATAAKHKANTTVAEGSSSKGGGASELAETEVVSEEAQDDEPAPAPTKSGRSRLIIQPK
ncbi:MAG: lipopolysaccharide export system protein LptA [Dinoroseobacter sp.]|jgi:lipopolysaccharide export system protein LptA